MTKHHISCLWCIQHFLEHWREQLFPFMLPCFHLGGSLHMRTGTSGGQWTFSLSWSLPSRLRWCNGKIIHPLINEMSHGFEISTWRMLEILGDHWAASIKKNKNVADSSCLWIQYLLGSFQMVETTDGYDCLLQGFAGKGNCLLYCLLCCVIRRR